MTGKRTKRFPELDADQRIVLLIGLGFVVSAASGSVVVHRQVERRSRDKGRRATSNSAEWLVVVQANWSCLDELSRTPVGFCVFSRMLQQPVGCWSDTLVVLHVPMGEALACRQNVAPLLEIIL